MVKHSLAAAVDDGTITERAAFFGLGPDDMAALRQTHPHAKVLVRYRSLRKGDLRTIMEVIDFPGAILSVGTLDDVRDVSTVVL
jgi:hypothetical protein